MQNLHILEGGAPRPTIIFWLCWVLGTTSFRTDQLNRKIEQQLGCLDELWSDDRYVTSDWVDVQEDYYELLQAKGAIDGDAPLPDKDARQKTSGLVELGLLNDERRLTNAGRRILEISKVGDFRIDTTNILDLPKDSYRYFCSC